MFSPPEHSPYIPDQIFCRRSNVGFPGIFLNICSCILCFGTCKNIIPVQCASRSEELKSDIFKSFQNYTIKIQNIIHQRVGRERREESVKTIGSLVSSAEHLSIINSTQVFFLFLFFCSFFYFSRHLANESECCALQTYVKRRGSRTALFAGCLAIIFASSGHNGINMFPINLSHFFCELPRCSELEDFRAK